MLHQYLAPFLGRACRGLFATEGVGDDATYAEFRGIVEKIDDKTIHVVPEHHRNAPRTQVEDRMVPIGQIVEIVGLP